MKAKSKITYLVVIFSVLVIVSLVFSMKFSHNALESANGTITINDVAPKSDHEYVTYRVFDYIEENGGYTCYIPNESSFWYRFATDENYGAKYVELIESNGSYLVSWKQNIVGNEILAYEFAKDALSYVKANYNVEDTTINKYSESTRTGDAVTITNLPMGYYVVDTANEENGVALCILSSVQPSAIVQEKLEEVVITKEIRSIIGPNGQDRGKQTASVGDLVTYRITVLPHRPYNNWIIHEEIGSGLTPNFALREEPDNLSTAIGDINCGILMANGAIESTSRAWAIGNCITTNSCEGGVKLVKNEDNTSSIEFHMCEGLIGIFGSSGNILVIEYSAYVSEDAKVDENGNSNITSKTWVSYGSDKTSNVVNTKIQSYNFDLIKTDSNNNILPDAKFNIYEANNNILIQFMQMQDENGDVVYCPVNRETRDTYNKYVPIETPITEIILGNANIRGLAAGSYYLVETEAPTITKEDGSEEKYNKLSSKVNIEIVPDTEKVAENGEEVDILKETSKIKIGRITSGTNNIKAEFDSDGKYIKGGVQIVNLLGAELPNTGSIETIILYIVGGSIIIAVITIFIIMYNKKKKNKNKDKVK